MKRLFASLCSYLMTFVVVLAAGFVGWHLWEYYMEAPWTRDGRLRADVVLVAADVSGLVTHVGVSDNQRVVKGQLLFVLDRPRYEIALAQAEAALTNQRVLLTEAVREQQRNRSLGSLVSTEIVEQSAAHVDVLKAGVAQAESNRDLARLNLDRTTVTASVDGTVTNVELRPGDYLTAGRSAIALVDTNSLHVDGYFEETKLDRIHVGDPAEVRLMGVDRILHGRVESIASAVTDRERGMGGDLVANVNPSFTWVRLAQRIPVRITLDQRPSDINLIVGRTATVTIIEPLVISGKSS